nr:AI-2E family transporter [Ktedonobacteraceae bacterium]
MSSNIVQEQSSIQPSVRTTWTRRLIVALTILAYIVIGAVVLYALSLISNALIVVLISALLAYMMYPFTLLLQRRLPQPLAIAIAYVVVVAVLSVIVYFVVFSLVRESSSSIQSLFGPPGQHFLQTVIGFLGQFGISQQQIDQYRNQLLSQVQGFIMGIVPLLTRILSNFITFIIIITLSVYFVVDGPRLVRWLCNKTPLAYRDTVTFLVHTLDRSVGGYFRGLLLLSAIGAVCTGVVLTLLHVPYATLLGVIFFLLFFIPMIGGYVSGMLCILAAIPQGWVTVLIVVVFIVLLQQIVLGQVLAPRIFSHSIGLHPIVALFALLAGGQLFGVLGGFFSVPLAGVIQEIITSFWKRWEHNHPQQFQTQVIAIQQPIQEVVPEKLDHTSTSQ